MAWCTVADTWAPRCLCNGPSANVVHPRLRGEAPAEPPLITSGDDLAGIGTFLAGRDHYSVADVLEYLSPRAPVESAS